VSNEAVWDCTRSGSGLSSCRVRRRNFEQRGQRHRQLDGNVDRNAGFNVFDFSAKQWQHGNGHESQFLDVDPVLYFRRDADRFLYFKRKFHGKYHGRIPIDDHLGYAQRQHPCASGDGEQQYDHGHVEANWVD